MVSYFNIIAILCSIPLIYYKYGTDTKEEHQCLLNMGNLEVLLNDIVLEKHSNETLFERTRLLHSSCSQTINCFENLNSDELNEESMKGWADFFVSKIKPVCEALRYQSGDFFKCISKVSSFY